MTRQSNAEQIVQSLEDAAVGGLYVCDADREEAVEIVARAIFGGSNAAFVIGLQTMREMLARFVEQGGDAVTANSIRLNWIPAWGEDLGRPETIAHSWPGDDDSSGMSKRIPRTPTDAMMEVGLYHSSADTDYGDVWTMWQEMWDRAADPSEDQRAARPPGLTHDDILALLCEARAEDLHLEGLATRISNRIAAHLSPPQDLLL